MKRILVCSPKGGSGKTHVSRNLAVAAARDGLSIATADLDPQEALSRWHMRRPDDFPSVTHLRMGWGDARRLAEDAPPEGTDLLIIDTPPSLHEHQNEMALLISCADLVLVPSRPSWDDVEASLSYLKTIEARGKRPIVVLNATMSRVNSAAEKEALMEVAEICPIEIAQRADYARLGVRGLGISDVPSHVGAQEFSAVWAFVRQRLGLKPSRRPGRGQHGGGGGRSVRAVSRRAA